jgi:hypothetical protein
LAHDILLLGVGLGDPACRLQKLSQLLFIEFAREGVDCLAAVYHVDCGYAFNLEGLGDLAELVDVDFEEFEFAGGLVDSLFETRGQLLAGPAPVCVEVDEEGFGAAPDDGLPVLDLLQLDDVFDVVLVELFALLFGLAEWVGGRGFGG